MIKTRKWIAFIVALCTVIGMCIPLSGTVSAADYTFQEHYTEDLGIALWGNMSMNNFFELVTYNENDYIVVPAQGGVLFVYDLTAYINGTPNANGNYIYAEVETGIGSPRGIAQIGTKIYSVGDAKYVAWYDFSTGENGKITLSGTGYGIVADESGNLFVCGASGTVFRIDAGGSTASVIYQTSRLTKVLSIACYNGKLYIQGTLKSTYGDGSEIHEIGTQKSDNGSYLIPILNIGWSYKAKRTLTLTGVGASYYMSCIDGMLFFGNVGSLVAVDTTATDLTRYYGRLNADNSVSLVTSLADGETAAPQILGILPVDSNGTGYAVISNIGLYAYDSAGKAFTVKTAGGAKSRDLRCRDTYIYDSSEYILTASTSAMSVWTLSGSGFPVTLGGANGIFKDGYTISSMRTMTPGVEGDDTVMYTGGYLDPQVVGYTPYSGGLAKAFSNGHAQTDSMLPYNGKLYAGCYSGAYLVEYDPATGNTRDLIDGGIHSDDAVSPNQIRIHALAAGDGMIFFSTIPDDQELGGYIGCYNIAKETYTVFAHSALGFTDQTVITLAYDEDNNILYGGSSVRGGTAAEIAEDAEAQLLAFQFDPSSDTLTHLASTTVGDLTPGDDTPLFVGGITQDPDSGVFWGKVSQTLFTFQYKNGALTTTHQWSADTYPSDRYTDSGSVSWFPRPILFDDDHLYVVMDQQAYGLSRFDLNADRTAVSNQTLIDTTTTRIYTMGTDKNIYIANGYNITRIVISRTTMMEQLIDSYSAGNAEMETVLAAYDALTEKEQSRLSSTHAAVMNSLLHAECYYFDASSQKVISTLADAIDVAGSGNTVYLLTDYAGNVTVENGVTLDLNGNNITGNVHVTNGYLTDTAVSGTITGTVSVPKDNPCMPLLVPETGNTYRLFAYTSVQTTAPKADENDPSALNFWFDLDFANTQAYELLKAGSNLKVGATLSWTESDGTVQSVEISFDEVVKKWAAADHTTQNQGLYVQVTGIPYFGVSNITVTPYFEAENTGLKLTLAPNSHEVVQFTGTAIFGAYPTDLIHK